MARRFYLGPTTKQNSPQKFRVSRPDPALGGGELVVVKASARWKDSDNPNHECLERKFRHDSRLLRGFCRRALVDGQAGNSDVDHLLLLAGHGGEGLCGCPNQTCLVWERNSCGSLGWGGWRVNELELIM